jgi:hypothetical protein
MASGRLRAMRRALLVWPAALAFGAGGVLLAHELAYRLVPTSPVPHGYLAHVPQVLLALSVPLLALALRASRAQAPAPHAFAFVGSAAFVVMEHAERLGQGVPWLLTRPVFLVGLALQLPFGFAAWLVARLLLAPGTSVRRVPPRLPRTLLALVPPPPPRGAAAALAHARPARAPPLLR